MANLSDRTEYFQKVMIDDVVQYDFGSFDFDGFDFGVENLLEIMQKDVGRPDLISYRAYGTMNYWWFILKYNKIIDPWNDIAEGQIFRYPNIEKVREFLKLHRKDESTILEMP